VLDIATQSGDFARNLGENRLYDTEFIGIHIDETAFLAAGHIHEPGNTPFFVMDAGQLDFEGDRFDTISILASLPQLDISFIDQATRNCLAISAGRH
jgi:ubiquinone/menaquinone biosynthesis C-methylase UbiE